MTRRDVRIGISVDQRRLDRDALLDAFQAATRAAVELAMTPRWRKRKRAALDTALDERCAQADAALERLGGRGGSPKPLRAIIDEVL